ncbi:hypothetical protein TCSYLVIO_004723 [Trypanosoma cruzi]|nr:hypothetical protein TCSYLVIO_004723 [Trypanosoma cruzi]
MDVGSSCIGANRMRSARNYTWASELHAIIFYPPNEPGHTHMDQCSANCLPSSAAQSLQTAVCFFLFREARMDSGFLGTMMAATECRNEVLFIPLSWNRLATGSPPANGENAVQVVAQWRVTRWAKTKYRWTAQPQNVVVGISWTPSNLSIILSTQFPPIINALPQAACIVNFGKINYWCVVFSSETEQLELLSCKISERTDKKKLLLT